jgi:hypothetical protein
MKQIGDGALPVAAGGSSDLSTLMSLPFDGNVSK